MCETSVRETAGRGVRAPRWAALYALSLPPLALLAVVDAVRVPEAARMALRILLGLAAFAGMAVWARRNRAAIDLAQSCDCAAHGVAVREIRSPAPAACPSAPEPLTVVWAADETALHR